MIEIPFNYRNVAIRAIHKPYPLPLTISQSIKMVFGTCQKIQGQNMSFYTEFTLDDLKLAKKWIFEIQLFITLQIFNTEFPYLNLSLFII